jgi:hypothetical protein
MLGRVCATRHGHRSRGSDSIGRCSSMAAVKQGAAVSVRLVRLLLRSDGKPPSNCPLSRRVPGVFVQRKRFRGVGNCFTSAPAASIDARSEGRFSGLIFLVELRTDADFYIVAALEECHRRPSFAELTARNSAVSGRQAWDSAHIVSRAKQKALAPPVDLASRQLTARVVDWRTRASIR